MSGTTSIVKGVSFLALLVYSATQLALAVTTHYSSEPRLRPRPAHASTKTVVPWAPVMAVSDRDRVMINENVKSLGSVYSDFREGHSTLFLLRIQKAGSSFLMGMCGTLPFEDPVKIAHNMSSPVCKHYADCEPWTLAHDFGLKDGSPECEDRKFLLHYGHPFGQPGLKRAFHVRPPRRRPGHFETCSPGVDCIPFIYSYDFKYRYQNFMTATEQSVVRGYFQQARVVSGHIQFGLHKIAHRGQYTYVTALRDPAKRVVSQWNWWTTLPGRTMIHSETFDTWSKGALAFKPNPDYGFFMRSNHMTRVLCGTIINASFPYGADFQNERTGAKELEPMTRAHLECAKTNLLSFALVVVLEDMKEFPGLQKILNRLLIGVPDETMALQNDNRTPMGRVANQVNVKTLPKEVLARIVAQNMLDYELFYFARELFHRQVRRLKLIYEADIKAERAEGGVASVKR